MREVSCVRLFELSDGFVSHYCKIRSDVSLLAIFPLRSAYANIN